MPIKKDKEEGHISIMSHLFPGTRDYKKHSYLAIPELSVLKEGEGTPVEARSVAIDHTNPPDVTESVRAVTYTVAKNTRSTTAAESQPQPTQSLPHVSVSGASGDAQEHVADSQGGAVIQEYHRSPLVNRRRAVDWQCSEEPHPAQLIPPRPVSHNLEVGSAVELVDPPGYGIIRWIGKFLGVNTDIAGVELVSCVFHCYSTRYLVLTLYCNAYVACLNETVRSTHENMRQR